VRRITETAPGVPWRDSSCVRTCSASIFYLFSKEFPMRVSSRLAIALALIAIMPFGVEAQEAVAPSAAPAVGSASATPAATPVTAAGPRLETSAIALQPSVASDSAEATQRRSSSRGMGQAQAMMIVGGAAVVVGIIIGDDVGTLIAVSGAVVGLYGLYQYLK
jgi:hypothetical protein